MLIRRVIACCSLNARITLGKSKLHLAIMRIDTMDAYPLLTGLLAFGCYMMKAS